MTRGAARTVAVAYDALGPRFGEWNGRIEGDPSARFLDDLARRAPDGGRLLDLGCGDGSKISRVAGHLEVLGVDLSEEQLRIARANVPEATFRVADFTDLAFPAATFDAVTALYSVMHVPRAKHRTLLKKIVGWLTPGGLFLASLSHVGGPDRTGEWLGVEMFFSGYDAETNRRLVREAGLEVIHDELVWMREPQREIAFLWVLARKPS